MKPELNLTAHTYRDPQRNEFTQVTAQCVCGRGGWIRLAKHPMPTKKIPVKHYEEVTNSMSVGDIIDRQRLGQIVREGDSIYLVTMIGGKS